MFSKYALDLNEILTQTYPFLMTTSQGRSKFMYFFENEENVTVFHHAAFSL